jgi:hypothetical protein
LETQGKKYFGTKNSRKLYTKELRKGREKREGEFAFFFNRMFLVSRGSSIYFFGVF